MLRHITFSKVLFAFGAWLVAWTRLAPAQTPPPMILEIDLNNLVLYWNDASDPNKLATDPKITNVATNTFMQDVWLADIVAVNGTPAEGTFVTRTQNLNYRPVPTPGQAIADITRSGGPGSQAFEILQPDGTPIGTIWGEVLVGGPPPPGSPSAITSMNGAIIGGTGAFFGVRGQCGLETSANVRSASETEDPANRRQNGGGTMRLLLYLIPESRPTIVATTAGPAVVHSADFSPVTAASPAKPGEILSLFATGLGPVRPSVDPGKPFPTNPLAAVNSPVAVTVNGVSADLIGAAGYPGSTDGYQVNFRVPPGAAHGTASLQLSVAWITSSAVSVPIQ